MVATCQSSPMKELTDTVAKNMDFLGENQAMLESLYYVTGNSRTLYVSRFPISAVILEWCLE